MKRTAPALAVGLFMWPVAVFAQAKGPSIELDSVRLTVALVEDPDFPKLDDRLIQRALDYASREFMLRFDATPPSFEVQYRFDVERFLSIYAVPTDPQCSDHFAARYHGRGNIELAPRKAEAIEFLKRWPLDSLRGFLEEDVGGDLTYESAYEYYVRRYTKTVDGMKSLKTPAGTPLIEPAKSVKRSFVAWMCALNRQKDFDVVITNTFILADLLTEPHPHSVFGKAKIGGIAARSPSRVALGGQALLATTFGIDTQLESLSELGGKPAGFEERAKILGAYLLAHEVAHAIFGIPDVFDHPKGCLMTSRPGATYREGLEELEKHRTPCPRCRPYVEARAVFDRGRRALEAGRNGEAVQLLTAAVKKMPKHFHGSRRGRMSEITVLASLAHERLGNSGVAMRYARVALDLDPKSPEASRHLAALKAGPLRAPGGAVLASRTSSTATLAAPRAKPQ